MMTKEFSYKQALVPISLENSKKFIILSEQHVTNINRILKNIKSDILADYIRDDNRDLTIITNKVTSTFNLNTIEEYIKNTNIIKSDEVKIARLLQFKLYLKILGISYILKNTNTFITTNVVEKII